MVFKRLVVVVGYLEQSIRDLLDEIAGNITVEYIVSPQYETTNNIYSLWLAREMIQEPFVLIESDLVFTPPLLEDMLLPDRIAISHIITLDERVNSDNQQAFTPLRNRSLY